jgi:hypothetical protein
MTSKNSQTTPYHGRRLALYGEIRRTFRPSPFVNEDPGRQKLCTPIKAHSQYDERALRTPRKLLLNKGHPIPPN